MLGSKNIKIIHAGYWDCLKKIIFAARIQTRVLQRFRFLKILNKEIHLAQVVKLVDTPA